VYRTNATAVAERYGLDPRKFRAWLRRTGVVGQKRDEIFMDQQKTEEWVEAFKQAYYRP
jgi:phage antirepressor YoqD-like protein